MIHCIVWLYCSFETIIHLILVPKKEETGNEKSFTLKDIALISSAEPGLSSGFSPEDQPEPGHWLRMSVRKLHGEGLLRGPLHPLSLSSRGILLVGFCLCLSFKTPVILD